MFNRGKRSLKLQEELNLEEDIKTIHNLLKKVSAL
jgi:hypothetical protein